MWLKDEFHGGRRSASRFGLELPRPYAYCRETSSHSTRLYIDGSRTQTKEKNSLIAFAKSATWGTANSEMLKVCSLSGSFIFHVHVVWIEYKICQVWIGETQIALDGGGPVAVSHCGRTRGPQILSGQTSVCGPASSSSNVGAKLAEFVRCLIETR
jgi:hypothetical protein